jgi:hypothetical protein
MVSTNIWQLLGRPAPDLTTEFQWDAAAQRISFPTITAKACAEPLCGHG